MEFLSTKGRMICSESGEEVLLIGYGIGNWMNQEGFLFGSSVFSTEFREFARAEKMDRGRSIDQTIIEVCGRTYAERFWKNWYKNYFGYEDIKDLKERGFNSVRLPLAAKVFLKEEPGVVYDQESFEILDQIIDWCEESGIYVVLDMHAAAGGQSGLLCDDGVDNYPHLYTDQEAAERTIVLWEELAKRYKERSVVAGYEILNEPLAIPRWDEYLPKLKEFYREAIERIRKIDQKHMIFLQGHRFASRNDIFEADMDPISHNWVLAMHMYETLPDLGVIGPILADAETFNVPIWMGETGGSSAWMTVLFEMLYENHIGVNVWCHKGVDSADAATLCTYQMPEGFDEIRGYAHHGGAKPSYERAIQIFDELLERIKYENCEKWEERANAIQRKPGVKVPAIGYDMMPGAGKSYQGEYPYCVFCGYRREDRMHLIYEKGFVPYESAAFAFCAMERPPKYGDWNHLELMLDAGNFACYTIRSIHKSTGVSLLCEIDAACSIEVSSGNQKISVNCSGSEGMTKIPCFEIASCQKDTVKVTCTSGSFRLKQVIFTGK